MHTSLDPWSWPQTPSAWAWCCRRMGGSHLVRGPDGLKTTDTHWVVRRRSPDLGSDTRIIKGREPGLSAVPTSPFPGPRGHPGYGACLLVPRWASGLWSRGQLSRSACPQPGLLPGLPLGKHLFLLPFLPGFRGCRLLLSLLQLHQNYRPS